MDASRALSAARVVCVAVIEDESVAVDLARTLFSAGIGFVEVTLRTDCAMEAIEHIAVEVPEIVIGAGSMRNADQLTRAKGAGAQFAVSPGSSDSLIDAAIDSGMPFVPGAATSTEMIRLLDRGYRLQKFFPSEPSGGVQALSAFGGPLPEVRFFPTGGIREDMAASYLALGNVACLGGTWLAPVGLLRTRSFDEIGRLAANAARL